VSCAGACCPTPYPFSAARSPALGSTCLPSHAAAAARLFVEGKSCSEGRGALLSLVGPIACIFLLKIVRFSCGFFRGRWGSRSPLVTSPVPVPLLSSRFASFAVTVVVRLFHVVPGALSAAPCCTTGPWDSVRNSFNIPTPPRENAHCPF
jgi:hypothetical protein